MTFYELTEGDMAHTTGQRGALRGGPATLSMRRTDFHLMPYTMLRRALDILVKQGKAQVFKGDDEGSEGVKFF